MEQTTGAAESAASGTRGGRKRDPEREGQILDVVLDVLADTGYAGLTMDQVARRARAGKATVYRRWASKDEMVIDALARLRAGTVPLDSLPDTGTLRGDLLALFQPQPVESTERRMKVMFGIASMIAAQPGLDAAVHETMVAPFADAHRALMLRAARRGEISASVEAIDVVAQVVPTVAAYRTLVPRLPFDQGFLELWVDTVVLPALRSPVRPD